MDLSAPSHVLSILSSTRFGWFKQDLGFKGKSERLQREGPTKFSICMCLPHEARTRPSITSRRQSHLNVVRQKHALAELIGGIDRAGREPLRSPHDAKGKSPRRRTAGQGASIRHHMHDR